MEENKEEGKTILCNVLQAHAQLDLLLADIPQERLLQGGVTGKWSIKDILAHITAGERLLLECYHTAKQGKPLPILEKENETLREAIDRVNEETYQAHRDCSLADVVMSYTTAFGKVLAMILELQPDDLAHDGVMATALGCPLKEWIAENTYKHYMEHAAAIRIWWKNNTIER